MIPLNQLCRALGVDLVQLLKYVLLLLLDLLALFSDQNPSESEYDDLTMHEPSED